MNPNRTPNSTDAALAARRWRGLLPASWRISSTARGLLVVALAVIVYSATFAGMFLLPTWWLRLLAVLVHPIAIGMLFVIGHDAAHNSLTPIGWLNRILGRLVLMPAYHPYTSWCHSHNTLHHGWTNVAECDYSWRPSSPAVYLAMPRWRRALERVYRSWWGLWLHSIVEIWWKHMALPRDTDRRHLHGGHLAADRLLVATSIAAHLAVCLFLAPQWSTIAGGPPMPGVAIAAAVVILPWWIFHVMFSAVTFLHHTHPEVRWYRTKRESNFFAGQVQATVHVELPTWVERLLHNITVHSAHHVDPRIPFRHLPPAQQRLESRFASDVRIERWSLASFISVTRTCQLYDYDTHRWVRFADARADA